MRIIAGKFRGRKLHALGKADIRPTSDRLRETLFDVISAARTIEGSRWLDLYAGTGAVGIEALSRGAAHVCFVEANRSAVALIRKNLATLDAASEEVEIVQAKALSVLTRLESTEKFDVCFLDPPYKSENDYSEVLGALAKGNLFSADALIIAEHSKRFDLPAVAGLARFRRLQQGDAVLSFFRRT